MRKTGIAAVCGFFVLFASSANASGPYCQGYRHGFKDGYCYGYHSCTPPYVPDCPIPYLGDSGYDDGYRRGYAAGRNAR